MEFGSFTISPQLQVDLEPKSSVKTTLEGVCLSGHLSDHLGIIHGSILGFTPKHHFIAKETAGICKVPLAAAA